MPLIKLFTKGNFNFAWKLARLPIFIYIGLLIVMFVFENRLVFQPTVETGIPPQDERKNNRHRYITVNEHQIHALFVERENPICYAIYFHGNGGNIIHRTSLLEWLSTRLNISILGVSYSGYGYSRGRPSERQFYEDAESSLAYMTSQFKIPPSRIMLFGESLGGVVATRLAAQHQIPLLALDSTFTSLCDVAQTHYPWLPVKYLMRNRFSSLPFAGQFVGTTIQTHGTDDQIVPFQLGKQLADSFGGNHTLIQREGGRHNEAPSGEYIRALEIEINKLYKAQTE